MSAELAAQIWSEVKRYMNSVDASEAAETLVNVLIDNDIDAEEIKNSFKGDSDVKRALAEYLKDEEDLEEDDDLEDYDEY